eukprot:4871693-Karenia_brevis.AAC.1
MERCKWSVIRGFVPKPIAMLRAWSGVQLDPFAHQINSVVKLEVGAFYDQQTEKNYDGNELFQCV